MKKEELIFYLMKAFCNNKPVMLSALIKVDVIILIECAYISFLNKGFIYNYKCPWLHA